MKKYGNPVANLIILLASKCIYDTDKTYIAIAKECGVSKSSVERINFGRSLYKKEKYTYPIRANKEINKAVSTILVSEE